MAFRKKSIGTLFVAFMFLMTILSMPVIINDAEATGITIIDYELEGIDAGNSQYYVLWLRGMSPVPIEINASVLEFVGATGWPQLSIEVFEYEDYSYDTGSLASCETFENYSCRLNFDTPGQEKVVVAVTNLDPIDDAVYNITFSSPETMDFQYTAMFDIDDVIDLQANTISITYFHTTNPYLFRLSSSGDSRIVVEYIPIYGTDEIYFMIYNKGNTTNLFVGILGIPYYEPYPSFTAYIIDFEDIGEDNNESFYLWTISNYSCSGFFTCESGHRYNFWIDPGYWDPDLYIVFDTFGNEELNYEPDLFAENPDGLISLRLSFTNPWLEYQDLQRGIFNYYLGVGSIAAGGGGVLLFSIWYYRRRYH